VERVQEVRFWIYLQERGHGISQWIRSGASEKEVLIKDDAKVFLFSSFVCPMAHGVPRPGIRSELQL